MREQTLDLMQLKKMMIHLLPGILREESEVAAAIKDILAPYFERLEQRVDKLELRVEQHHRQNQTRFNDLESRIEAHRIESRERFEQVDRRFEQVDRRFEQVDRRFEQVDQRFDQVDRRFDKVEGRLDEHGGRLSKIEKTMLQMRRDIVKLQAGQDNIIKRLDHQEVWLKLMTGHLWDEKGERLEDMMAIAMRYGLKNPNITPESIRLRQKLVDTEGLVFKRGFETEVDLIALDDTITVFSVFEVKASLKNGDVDIFSLKVELIAAQNPDKKVHGVLIALSVYPEARERCEKYNIELYP